MSAAHLARALGLAAGLATAASAQQPDAALPDLLTLPALLRLVAERSPRLAAERVAIAAAEAERIIAGALPNPSVSVGRSRPSGGASTVFEGSRQTQAGVDLPLLIGGQRGARIETAEQGILGAQARVEQARSELAAHAAETFTALQSAQEKVAALAQAQAEIERAAALVSGRLESGMASRYERTRVEIEVAAISARLAEARADAGEKSAGLALLLGAPGWRPVAAGTPQPGALRGNITEWRALLAAGNPQIAAARREEDVARAAVGRAGAERWPVPVLSLGRTWTSEPFGAANFIGLSTEIPVFDTRRGQLAKAQADLLAAERRRQAVEAEAGVELQRAADALAERRSALDRFGRNVDVRDPALKQMAEDAYRLGRGTLLELIDAARTRLDARLTDIDLRQLAAQQELRILALTGGLGR